MNTALRTRDIFLLGMLTLLFSADAQATVYRCGQTYQQTPCEGGKAVEVPAGPSPAEVQAAQERAAATRQWAEGMTEDRLAREKALAKTRREERTAHQGGTRSTSAAAASAASAGRTPDCTGSSVRHAGMVSEAEARRTRRTATRCKALAAYASLPASSPTAQADSARQPLPASAAARSGR
ncbi:DUF4124 domain-containing protein [Ideonella dechloratans]|uniref:DUF4124 domain-containing protein n=1 Tax=Ideonella dechloratans TaxID=36863 RepID=A0A643FJ72_IDEDE|nr:DUF4124 domain-containing protein [Ideonella dechloratans]KAB0584440.1 DUF4124 domain-containing protein [Ideonella dechloratans]UFU10880.1 DUF4124 domain-containing protein [Ideonella dechloratans]